MKHVIRIKEGRFLTKIDLEDDNHKKSMVLLNSYNLRMKRTLEISRDIEKIKKMISMYNELSEDQDKKGHWDIKQDAEKMISTVALFALEKAFKKGKIEKDTIKEVLDGFFIEKDQDKITDKKDVESLKVDVDPTKVLKNIEETNKGQNTEEELSDDR